MADWKEYKLGDFADIQTGPFGSQLHAADYILNGIPSIMPTNIGSRLNIVTNDIVCITEKDAERLKKYTVKSGDIVYSRRGDVEKCAFITSEQNGWLCGTGSLRIRFISNEIEPKFCAYYLSTPAIKSWVLNNSVGSTMPNLNSSILKNLPLQLPPLSEQQAIAEVLSSLDDKIDLLHRQNKTLEAMAETLFRQWFVEEAEESWESGKLGDFVETTLGGEWGKENPEGDYQLQVQCIRGTDVADLQKGIAERTPIRFIKTRKFESIEIKEGDLIMEISGGSDDQSTGRTIYINDDIKAMFNYPLVFSNFCRLIRPKRKEYGFFLYLYIQFLYKQGDLFNLENGTSGIRNLDYKSLLFQLNFKLPNSEKVIRFDEEVSGQFRKINTNKHQIRTLIKLRDELLPKLMSGDEVRVKVAEAETAAVN